MKADDNARRTSGLYSLHHHAGCWRPGRSSQLSTIQLFNRFFISIRTDRIPFEWFKSARQPARLLTDPCLHWCWGESFHHIAVLALQGELSSAQSLTDNSGNTGLVGWCTPAAHQTICWHFPCSRSMSKYTISLFKLTAFFLSTSRKRLLQ